MNPFNFVSGVEIDCEHADDETTRITIRPNRWRAFVWVAFWTLFSFMAALAMPQPVGAILVLIVASAAWFGIVTFLAGHLIVKEIGDHLQEPPVS